MVVDLSGYWLFRTGDDPAWQQDIREISGWDSLIVPLKWEMQGYAEYDGFAWYRRTVEIGQEHRDENLVLALGKIDDVDEVYFNGKRIGRTGHFPAAGEDISANDWWQRDRFYTIPGEMIRFDRPNTIAVRTFDAWIDGGIYDGVVGIMTRRSYLRYRNNSDNQLIEMLKKWFEPTE
jgi:sialate O-acetylesterase